MEYLVLYNSLCWLCHQSLSFFRFVFLLLNTYTLVFCIATFFMLNFYQVEYLYMYIEHFIYWIVFGLVSTMQHRSLPITICWQCLCNPYWSGVVFSCCINALFKDLLLLPHKNEMSDNRLVRIQL